MTTLYQPSAAAALAWLRHAIANFLSMDEREIATDRPLGELGIDSLTAAELSAEIEDSTGKTVPLEGLLGKQTLADVADALASHGSGIPDGDSEAQLVSALAPGGE